MHYYSIFEFPRTFFLSPLHASRAATASFFVLRAFVQLRELVRKSVHVSVIPW